jgi:protein-disulfide isomerase
MRRLTVVDVVTALLVGSAFLAVGLAVERRLGREPARRARATHEANWRTYAAVGHRVGGSEGAVEIVEFGDFECPFCRRFSTYVDSLNKLGKNVTVIYRHVPSRNHLQAIPAVRASECASLQGKFGEMYAALVTFADSLGKVPFEWYAGRANIPDSVSFQRCITSSEQIPALSADSSASKELHVTGTPTLLIESQRYDGLPPFDSLAAYVDRARASRNQSQR